MIRIRWSALPAVLALSSCAYATPPSPFETPDPADETVAVLVRNWDYSDVGVELGSPAPDRPSVVAALSAEMLSAEHPMGGTLKLRILFQNVDGPRTLTDFVAITPGERIQLTIHDSADRWQPGFRPYSITAW